MRGSTRLSIIGLPSLWMTLRRVAKGMSCKGGKVNQERHFLDFGIFFFPWPQTFQQPEGMFQDRWGSTDIQDSQEPWYLTWWGRTELFPATDLSRLHQKKKKTYAAVVVVRTGLLGTTPCSGSTGNMDKNIPVGILLLSSFC